VNGRNLKRDWVPDAGAFHRLLVWLDEGVDSDGQRYVEMRRRLADYFDRRGAPSPEALADDTLNRVARRLDETGAIDDVAPARYCYITAKFVLLESLRQAHRETQSVRAAVALASGVHAAPVADAATDDRQRLLDCLARCLASSTPADRTLILEYYSAGAGTAIAHRKRLALGLALTSNALAIRACRVRERLEDCVRRCAEQP
jgi:DNA-directed RNA polymerase specialized sigma24 family protein